MAWQGLDTDVAQEIGEGLAHGQRRRLDTAPEYTIVRTEDTGSPLVRWASAHKLLVTIAALVLFVLCMVCAFEAGHAYAEGVRTVGGFVDHLNMMRESILARLPDGWMWRNT